MQGSSQRDQHGSSWRSFHRARPKKIKKNESHWLKLEQNNRLAVEIGQEQDTRLGVCQPPHLQDPNPNSNP